MNVPSKTTREHFKPVKAPLHLYNMKTTALGHGLEPNLALGFAMCYISFSPTLSCFYFHFVHVAVHIEYLFFFSTFLRVFCKVSLCIFAPISRIAHAWSSKSMVSCQNEPMRVRFEWDCSHLNGYFSQIKKLMIRQFQVNSVTIETLSS